MDLLQDVFNRITIPRDPEEKFVYHSEWLTAAALTQTYGYMIENGLEYSKLATGQADVFLQVREHEPHTLYYHLAEPNIEAEAQSGVDILLYRTAVGQSLSFSLLALASRPYSQSWRNHTLETASRVVIDYEAILRQMPAGGNETPPPSVFQARIHPFKRSSPIMLRSRKSQKAASGCRPTDITVHEDPQSPSNSSDESSDIKTPSKQSARTREAGSGHISPSKTPQVPNESNTNRRQYCTQGCLLGVVRRLPLDEFCPNVSAHRVYGSGNHHALEQETLAQSIQRQLKADPDNGCEPLGKQGARGALFRLTLVSFGYTFVAKGTVEAFIPHLKHEGRVYRHLSGIQGDLIPVYLGNISLAYPYFLDFGVRIKHMLLMSWAGERVQEDLMSSLGRDVQVEINQAVTTLRSFGVEHGDAMSRNVLWDIGRRKLMLVDFERSEIFNRVSILQEISPNRKRKHLHSSHVPATATPKPLWGSPNSSGFEPPGR